MRNCFVPMCDAKCRDWTKRMMFMAPKDDVIFQMWLDVLPQQRRAFRKTDRICERHFLRQEIITTWDHIINGEVHQLERTKPKLRPDAVPSQNLEYTPPTVCRKSRDKLKQVNAKKMKLDENGVTSAHTINKDSGVENFTTAAPDTNKVIDVENVIVQESTDQSDTTPTENTHCATTETDSNVVVEHGVIPEIQQKFESLFDDIFEVSLPNTLWGWHRDVNRKYICASQFSIEFKTTIKMIIIYNSMMTKTFILDKEIAETELADSDPDNLAAIIDTIDKLKICPGVTGDNREKCLYIIDDTRQAKCPFCRTGQSKASG